MQCIPRRKDAVVAREQLLDDDILSRVGCVYRIGPLRDVYDTPVEADGMVLVDLPHECSAHRSSSFVWSMEACRHAGWVRSPPASAELIVELASDVSRWGPVSRGRCSSATILVSSFPFEPRAVCRSRIRRPGSHLAVWLQDLGDEILSPHGSRLPHRDTPDSRSTSILGRSR